MSADFVPDPPVPLPIASNEDQLGDQGVRTVDRIVSEDRDRRVTGRMVAAQIKCGKSWFVEPTSDGSGWTYRGELRHLNYWLGHSLPVILVLCDPDTGDCYFTHVAERMVG